MFPIKLHSWPSRTVSLRSLFIVLALAGLAANSLNRWQTVHERRQMLDWIKTAVGGRIDWSDHPAAWQRRIFGDVAIDQISLPSSTAEEAVDRVAAAFPEAKVVLFDGFPDGPRWDL